MLYLTYNEKEGRFKTTKVATKSVAYCGSHYQFNDFDTDYARSSAELATSNLKAKKIKLCSCAVCHQPFATESGSLASRCPYHSPVGSAVHRVEGRA